MKHRVVAGTFLALGIAWGCAGSTGSKRFAFDARIGGVEDRTTFTNETGWTITLTKAEITLGPVYLNVVAPLRDSTQSLRELFVKNAWAHGEGHLDDGRVVGEVLGQVRFDALSSELVTFPVRGTMTQDEVRTSEIWFYPEPGVSAESTKIATVALDVAGVAVRDSTNVAFRGQLILNDAWQPDQVNGTRGTASITGLRQVRGIPSSFFPDEGGHLEIRLDVARLFRGANFANLEANPTDRDGTKVLVQSKSGAVSTDQVMTNLYQGLHDATGTYAVRWIPR
ncbi:hypothetical protein AKJ09_01411 [Labilithrix luteola]|uniref:Uncharacterized protein n=1 Tax=Labilithrix luteola TaxID=1391654 RepID=A0A0K1PML1_9BACT|nr:hypothetical protein [Labilithrix luteola]AKU94747.1 hypothetical protein AKJ09_01411 [Labilithrix luteola]